MSRKLLLFALLLSGLIHVGAAALSLSTPPDLEIEGGGPVSHAVLGQSPFDTVVAGTTAAVTHAEKVAPNSVQEPKKPEQTHQPKSVVTTTRQPVETTSKQVVSARQMPVTPSPQSSPKTVPLKATNASGVAFSAEEVPASQPASPVIVTPAAQPESLKTAQASRQPAKAIRVESRTAETVTARNQMADPAPVRTVKPNPVLQQVATTETGSVPPPPVKPKPPRQTPSSSNQTTPRDPEKKAQKRPANTRSGAGGKSAQTTQKGGSQKQGARASAGNSDVNNYPAKVHRKLVRAVRAPRGGRKARQDAVVRFTVARNGAVSGVRLARSSGSKPFDQAALKAVRSAAPFPPIPAEAGKRSWTFTLPVGVP